MQVLFGILIGVILAGFGVAVMKHAGMFMPDSYWNLSEEQAYCFDVPDDCVISRTLVK